MKYIIALSVLLLGYSNAYAGNKLSGGQSGQITESSSGQHISVFMADETGDMVSITAMVNGEETTRNAYWDEAFGGYCLHYTGGDLASWCVEFIDDPDPKVIVSWVIQLPMAPQSVTHDVTFY